MSEAGRIDPAQYAVRRLRLARPRIMHLASRLYTTSQNFKASAGRVLCEDFYYASRRNEDEYDVEFSESILSMLEALCRAPIMKNVGKFSLNTESQSSSVSIQTETESLYNLLSSKINLSEIGSPTIRGELRRVTPPQSLGPVQFGVHGQRLVIVPAPSRPDDTTASAAEAAREALREIGEQLVAALRSSNCDPRLLRSVSRIQQLLVSGDSVIQLGILNSGLGDSITLLESELAASMTLDLRTYSNGLRMYVGQFEDWARFLENAVNAELRSADASALAAAADNVVRACRDQPEFADPEVPKTIIALRELLTDPSKAAERSMFAMVRTLENLCAAAFGHIAATADETVTTARKTFSKAAGAAIGGVLLVIAAQAAGALGPISARVSELKWVEQGLELAKKLMPME